MLTTFLCVQGKYNDYLRVSRGNVGNATCNRPPNLATVHYISENTKLIKLISLKDTNENDWLYNVLMEIVSISFIIVYIHYTYLLEIMNFEVQMSS